MNENENKVTIDWVRIYLINRGFSVMTDRVPHSRSETYDVTITKNGFHRKERLYGLINMEHELVMLRLNRMILDFEKDYEENKKSMKNNISIDVMRNGPMGKLVIKEDVHDVCITEVRREGSFYNDKVTIIAEVTDGWCSNKPSVTFNPTRKDSINEGKVQIKDVIFNPPATIVFWSDDTKTVVKAENEIYDPEKGLAMAIAKRAMGNQGNYFDTFKKYVEPYKKKCENEVPANDFLYKLVGMLTSKPIGTVKSVEETEGGVTVKAELIEPISEPKKPYRIWYEDEDGDIMILYHTRTYIRKGNAINAAKKIFADGHTKWIVSQGNPVITGEWAKKFGSDDK